MDPHSLQTQDRLAVSASMRTALLVYSGIAVRMMVDTDLGATLSTMFMVQYQPDGVAGAHDHPFEEAYLSWRGRPRRPSTGAVRARRPVTSRGRASAACTASATRWRPGALAGDPGAAATRRGTPYRFARDWDYLRQEPTEETL